MHSVNDTIKMLCHKILYLENELNDLKYHNKNNNNKDYNRGLKGNHENSSYIYSIDEYGNTKMD